MAIVPVTGPTDGIPHVLVVGGGVTGLAAAHELVSAGARVTLVEASDRFGGRIRSGEICGRTIDVGPDSFIARVPWAIELCEELGLGAELIAPARGSAYVWAHGALRPLPAGLVLGIPTDLDALGASGIVSETAVERAAQDLLGGHDRFDPRRDTSVGELVRSRLGDEIVDYLVDPMVGGINAGRADELSVAATTPQFALAAARHDSLLMGLRAQGLARNTQPETPVFQSITGGLHRLPQVLADRLADRADLRLGTPARLVGGGSEGGYGVELPDGAGSVDPVAAVVLALPAPALAQAVAAVAPGAVEPLHSIDYASVALTHLAFEAGDIPIRLDRGGFLVPRPEGLLMSACTWFSAKWPAAVPAGAVVLRVSAGRIDDERIAAMSDDELVAALCADLATTMGVTAEPREATVTRYPDSFPQYRPGHLQLIDRIEDEIRLAAPNVVATGAAFRGLGIPACIHQGREAAQDALRSVRG